MSTTVASQHERLPSQQQQQHHHNNANNNNSSEQQMQQVVVVEDSGRPTSAALIKTSTSSPTATTTSRSTKHQNNSKIMTTSNKTNYTLTSTSSVEASENCLVRLVRLLDLRFSDPKVESSYHTYYAQVKRNLLPTAIQVVLLVNVLQFLATCLNYYLLIDGFTHNNSNNSGDPDDSQPQALTNSSSSSPISDAPEQQQQQPQTSPLLNNLIDRYARTLYWPFIVQLGVFVATFAMLKRVRAELGDNSDQLSGGTDASGSSQRRRKRHRGSSSAQATKISSSSNSSCSSSASSASDSEQDEDKTTRATKQHGGRHHSGASGLSLSVSLAIEMPRKRSQAGSQSSGGSSASSSSDSDDMDGQAAEAIKLSTGGRRKRKSTESRPRSRQSRSRKSSASSATQRGHSNWRLSPPYLLWVCQVIQLASGLWPQQSFITYSTLLLYSYAIYVIFPIRLHSCILLASGLCLIEPILDYFLLLNLSRLFHSAPAPSALSSSTSTLISEPLGAPEASPFTWLPSDLQAPLQLMGRLQALANKSAPIQTPTSTLINNSLAIPMTSQLSKLWAFMILTLGINVIGIMSFFFYERQQRAAFLETRQSLETKLILEQESREQERLLLSILPKHLASEIRQDLGAVVTGQFKKIYMSRHENVSILFADIVGFTAISSHCPAPELVKTLNELFARFDKLAEKYHQLRIKILGDCYYAISGAPQERPDHAVLCVHMGLSMVEAVKSVRERTKSTVDMRVGVHTGGVLAGVLGQRQWQFDVYSKDVELANKMESSGMPGRVHISDATLRFLNDEFEVSPADGAAKEEALRLANIQTYFIDRVKKPYPEGTLDSLENQQDQQQQQQRPPPQPQVSIVLGQSRTGAPQKKFNQLNENQTADKSASANDKKQPLEGSKQRQKAVADSTTSIATTTSTSAAHQQKQRNDSFNLDKQIKQFSLNFSNRHFERQFRSTSDIASCISLVGLPITLICANLAYVYLYKVPLQVTVVYAIDSIVLILAVLICVLPYLWRRHLFANGLNGNDNYNNSNNNNNHNHNKSDFCRSQQLHQPRQAQRQKCLAKYFVMISDAVGRIAWMKLALSALMTLIWLSAHLVACVQTIRLIRGHELLLKVAEFNVDTLEASNKSVEPEGASYVLSKTEIFSVDLLNYFSITCALAITAITRISFLVKTLIIFAVILIQVILNKTILSSILMLRSGLFQLMPTSQQADEQAPLGGISSPASSTTTTSTTTAGATLNSGGDLKTARWPPSSELSSAQLIGNLLIDFDQYVFMLTLVTICWALFLMNRQFELTNRRLFLWRKQVEERKEKVADMRRKNEALVYNILPPNVAKIFLGRRQLNDEELYSKSYDAVGVLFAAMPNFSDFYTEESVNNQGLECLRFLNEVISDYDALLDQERFKNIIKIKTMGSTYMAASGLYEGDAQAEREAAEVAAAELALKLTTADNPTGVGAANDDDDPDQTSAEKTMIITTKTTTTSSSGTEPDHDKPNEKTTPDLANEEAKLIKSKWGHLEQLTEFALALKDTLNNINKESFNNFVLRIGINQGPITAGVIGVKKPHFDMWGNTVNVASRMESTGRAGSIQVVEETATILRHFGFEFDPRGLVSVKGKGQLMTFYLTGRSKKATSGAASSAGSSPALAPAGQPQQPSSPPPLTSTTTTTTTTTTITTDVQRQQPTGGAGGGAGTAATDTSDRRMFIRPSKADSSYADSSGADIHLV